MAYINVAEWSPDQVTDWLKGLDDSMYYYIKSFTNNEVKGQELLNIRPYELEQLGMHLIGHQEIVLEAVEHLRNFHYHLDKENLQFLALHVATTAQCLHNQLKHFDDESKIETQILSDITRTIATIKPLIGWLDRSPFHGKHQFCEVRNKMLQYAIEMAMSAQRDRFVRKPVYQIKKIAQRVAELANYIIQDISDPMILQPASLNLVTLKKKESELGFNIVPSYHGIHVVTDIKYNSPAHTSGKIEDGDEIVQINYQTVVGWQSKKVMDQLHESPPDILITLKKRPKHTKIYGQIYMKPYRLPSKKKALPYRWGETLPSPRTELLPIQDFPLPLSRVPEKNTSSDSDCSDILIPTNPKVSDKDLRLYLPKPRAVLQRRNTICGDQVYGFKSNIMFWHERKNRENADDSPSLRDKSVSFGFGLEIAPRPTTCLGIGNSGGKFNDFSGLKGSLPEMTVEKTKHNESNDHLSSQTSLDSSKPGISKVVRFDSTKEIDEYKESKYMCNVENTILEVFEPIPYVDEDELNIPHESESKNHIEEFTAPKWYRMTPDTGVTQAVNEVLVNKENIKRGKFDKSYSTPAYDGSEDDSDVPPAIEPRKEFLQKTPPAPPPRPKKWKDSPPSLNTPTAIKLNTKTSINLSDDTKSKQILLIDLKKKEVENKLENNLIDVNERGFTPPQPPKKIPATKHFLEECFEELELLTPNKTKNLTLKKKNSIMAKRRNISLKTLEISDIQGHLYRRSKDKHGVTYWAKLYFVLTDTSLYGFKFKESIKANCLIFLPGFTVSLATEVHSKPYAFKVYHPTKTFYFAAESQQALGQWMEYIKQATIKGNTSTFNLSADHNVRELFSETESSDDEFELGLGPKYLGTPSPINNDRSSNKKSGEETKHEKYHLGFGSLKKFTKQNLPFSSHKNDKDKKVSSDVPVPTAQFRSYRKVPGNAGLQLGTNSMISSTGASDFVPPVLSIVDSSYKTDVARQTSANVSHTASPLPEPSFSFFKTYREIKPKPKKLRKTSPYNYIHASNPNLVEFDFPTSKTLDYSFPKVNPSNSWDAHNNLQGFVTLKDLMLQKQEEDAQEMYNNRVYLGVEKKNDKPQKRKQRRSEISQHSKTYDENGQKQNYNKIQSRSLPKTPDYAQSFKPDDSDIIMTRSKEGQKLRDFGYEFISGDDPIDKKNATNREAKPQERLNFGKKKGINWISAERKSEDDKSSRAGSFKKSKNKLVVETFESFKTSSEKLFQFKYTNNDKESLQYNQKSMDKIPLKPVTSYSPLTLPLNKKSSQAYSINSDGNAFMPQSSLKKSNTYNTPDFRDNNILMESPRKNSAPERSASYFTKLTFTGKSAKEKKLLGSPRLHRAIFGRRESETQQMFDHELFSPMDFKPRTTTSTPETPESVMNTPPIQKISLSTSAHTIGSPDYPNLEYPPVFEAETYSLSDPHTSLTLLRRRNHNQSK